MIPVFLLILIFMNEELFVDGSNMMRANIGVEL